MDNNNNNNNNVGDNKIAIFETSMGIFRVELYCTQMPITCGNIIDLINNGFYNNLYFHRVIPNFMNQFGCPNTRNNPMTSTAGTGGPDPNTTFTSATNPDQMYNRNDEGGIPDELTHRISNTKGTLSMANTGAPESGGSQFFINVADNTFLDWFNKSTESAHPVFGKVIDNYELLERISQVPTNEDDNPKTPIQMISVRIQE